MIDYEKLKPILEEYKKNFKWKSNRRIKWRRVKHFQEQWKREDICFLEKFQKAMSYVSGVKISRLDVENQCKNLGENLVSKIFNDLYDEQIDLKVRINNFIKLSSCQNIIQSTAGVSNYLALMYPDKYYFYSNIICSTITDLLDFEQLKKFEKLKSFDSVAEMLLMYFKICDNICEYIKRDKNLINMLKSKLTDMDYDDNELHILVYDILGFYANHYNEFKNEQDEVETDINPYTKYDFLNDVYISENEYNKLITLLKHKKNIILQGAPGVGKTFAAKRLAYAMMGEIDESRIEFIQFHQNYSYEDFIMGYRPDGEGFKLTEGIFYRFCQKAANNPDKEHFFIIDEINRGNMSKIFGELMMLIEKDYRGTKATLAYSGMPFSVPENLYIIGMMNTADRSLAMIDYALRRRFSFFEMKPRFNSEGFSKYRKSFENETFDALIEMIKILNKDISDDKSLGRGFRIGHSYFCGCDKDDCTTDWMRAVVEFDILPMLEEYWFDEPSKLQQWKNNLRGVFDD